MILKELIAPTNIEAIGSNVADKVFEVISSRISEQGIYASSWELNVSKEEYYKIATVGECTPIAYDNEYICSAFIRHIIRVISKGQDFTYQPQMKANDEMKNANILVYTCSEHKLVDERVFYMRLPQYSSYYELINLIETDADKMNAKVVVLTNAEQAITHCCQKAFSYLNNIAWEKGLLILTLFNITDTTDEVNLFLANNAHNLCQLTEENIIITDEEGSIKHDYIAFRYGRPSQHMIAYGLDNNGEFTFVPNVYKLLRMQVFGKIFAGKPIALTKLIDEIFGATNGSFEKQSIYNMISLAINKGILSKSGDGCKTKVWFNAGKPIVNPYKSNIAFTANAYLNADERGKISTYRQRKGLVRFGDFRIITAAFEAERVYEVSWNFQEGLIEAVANNSKFLDFKLKTTHRNTLILSFGNDDAINNLRKKLYNNRDLNFDFVNLDDDINDADFLQSYRSLLNKKQYDFVFIFDLCCVTEKENNIYSVTQLCNEIAKTSKQKGIVTIAQTNILTKSELQELSKDIVWAIEPLQWREEWEEVRKLCIANFPQYFAFKAETEKGQFICNFKDVTCKKLAKGEYIKAYLISHLYGLNSEERGNIDLTDSQISKAKKLGLISITYKGKKSLSNAYITFNFHR